MITIKPYRKKDIMNDTNSSAKRLSEEFFQNIFAQAGDGIFLINEQTLIVEANPRGCEILGYERDELLGRPVLSFQPPDAVEHIMNKLAQLAVERLVTTESVFLHKNGSRIPVALEQPYHWHAKRHQRTQTGRTGIDRT
jgi:PAS domain S-box-containing protein